jgi:hypothetical protein
MVAGGPSEASDHRKFTTRGSSTPAGVAKEASRCFALITRPLPGSVREWRSFSGGRSLSLGPPATVRATSGGLTPMARRLRQRAALPGFASTPPTPLIWTGVVCATSDRFFSRVKPRGFVAQTLLSVRCGAAAPLTAHALVDTVVVTIPNDDQPPPAQVVVLDPGRHASRVGEHVDVHASLEPPSDTATPLTVITLDPSIVDVPSAAMVAPGQSAVIPITTKKSGSTAVTVSAGAGTASALLMM